MLYRYFLTKFWATRRIEVYVILYTKRPCWTGCPRLRLRSKFKWPERVLFRGYYFQLPIWRRYQKQTIPQTRLLTESITIKIGQMSSQNQVSNAREDRCTIAMEALSDVRSVTFTHYINCCHDTIQGGSKKTCTLRLPNSLGKTNHIVLKLGIYHLQTQTKTLTLPDYYLWER